MREPKVCCPLENLDLLGLSEFGFGRGLGRVSLMIIEDTLVEEGRVVLPGVAFLVGKALVHGGAADEESSGI